MENWTPDIGLDPTGDFCGLKGEQMLSPHAVPGGSFSLKNSIWGLFWMHKIKHTRNQFFADRNPFCQYKFLVISIKHPWIFLLIHCSMTFFYLKKSYSSQRPKRSLSLGVVVGRSSLLQKSLWICSVLLFFWASFCGWNIDTKLLNIDIKPPPQSSKGKPVTGTSN